MKKAKQSVQIEENLSMVTTNMKNSVARLTNHIRLMIYSFIDTKMCLTHLTRLSKKEKERLMDSYFIREGRT